MDTGRPIYVTVAAAHLHSPQTPPPSLSTDPPGADLEKCGLAQWKCGFWVPALRAALMAGKAVIEVIV